MCGGEHQNSGLHPSSFQTCLDNRTASGEDTKLVEVPSSIKVQGPKKLFLKLPGSENMILKAEKGSSMQRVRLFSCPQEKASNSNNLFKKLRLHQPPPLYRQARLSICLKKKKSTFLCKCWCPVPHPPCSPTVTVLAVRPWLPHGDLVTHDLGVP